MYQRKGHSKSQERPHKYVIQDLNSQSYKHFCPKNKQIQHKTSEPNPQDQSSASE